MADLATLLAEPLYILTDTAIVGHLGTEQLAGLALASTVLVTGYAMFVFLAYGTTAAVSRLLGAGDERAASAPLEELGVQPVSGDTKEQNRAVPIKVPQAARTTVPDLEPDPDLERARQSNR